MADKTVPIYVIDENGNHIQAGWATPDNGTGVRSINLLEGFEHTSLSMVHFDDVEPFVGPDLDPAETQEPPRTYEEAVGADFVDLEGNVLEPADPEVPQAGSEVTAPEEIPEVPLPAEPIEVAPEEPQASEPIQVEPEVETPPVDNQPDEDDLEDDLEGDPEWDALLAEEAAENGLDPEVETTAPAEEEPDQS